MNPLKDVSLVTKFLMLKAFINVVRDIERTDEVFKISERIPDSALETDMRRIAHHPRAGKAFKEQPILELDIPALGKLPEGTLGREYSEFMTRRGLSPDFYPPIAIVSPAKYYRFHLYQTHDLWHIVTGFPANPAGELGLQAFYYAQNELPLPPLLLAAGILNGALRDPSDVPNRIAEIARGWRMGRQSDSVFGYDWAGNWETPLAEVRRELGIETATSALPSPAFSPRQASAFTGAALVLQ